ncbi:hypothetical protein NBRC3257_0347 [Gluconobacter thailandicus NBRC 3257]|uniref:Uncharacterized protein n=1 Tax=Gluconobacter thailandicus NBRC 3257 TaxID=1381097 RepID=A0ABQ0IT08_GLUTH|nr:hypothetical protein NBRC3255_1350 [Gluconobacter thailandicus NBRC 3255]GAD25348.1 hypothetical protein NBRC3257_0347 [Gluconobacter thailandicus NBRC 3257]
MLSKGRLHAFSALFCPASETGPAANRIHTNAVIFPILPDFS